MLHPQHNRINFGQALRPIDGYELDYAIGTTYTLDLEAVMFLPVALFFGEDLAIEKYCSNELLTALTKVPEKVQLFCQRGKIVAPYFYHNILEYWSENVEQVQMDAYNESFHPKIWLLRYVPLQKNKPEKYRFICTSRNLSKSSDWDLAITLEGTLQGKTITANRPLLDFIAFLNGKARKKIKQQILKEISQIQFELEPGQDLLQFFPISPTASHPLLSEKYFAKKLLVITPFVDEHAIRQFKAKTKKLVLLSAKYELDKLPMDLFNVIDECYQFNPLLEMDPVAADEVEGNQDLSDTCIEPELEYSQGNALHAKLYVANEGGMVSWYVGSANCTSPACSGRNIEFLTALSGTSKRLMGPDELLEQVTLAEKGCQGIFVPYVKTCQIVDEEQEKMSKDLRRTIFDISQLACSGSVIETENRLFDYHIQISAAYIAKREDWQIFLQPLSGMKGKMEEIINAAGEQEYIFPGYELHRLTPYFHFSIMQDGVILKTLVVKLDMIFPEDRMKKIFTSIIGNWEKLMKYLSFLLTSDQIENLVELSDSPNEQSASTNAAGWNADFPIYEKLLVAASRDPRALKHSIDVVTLLQNELDINGTPVVEKEFKDLIETFKEIMNHED